MKKIIAFMLVLVMALSLCACGGEKNDEAFIKNLQKGLDKRLSMVATGNKDFSANGQQTFYTNCAKAELDAIGNLSEYVFTDPELEEIANEYVVALNKQVEGAKYCVSNYTQFQDIYSSQGYYPQMSLVSRLNDDFGLTVNKKYAEQYGAYLADGELYRSALAVLEAAPTLESLGGTRSQILIENTGEYDLSGAQMRFNFYDEDGILVGNSSTYLESWKAGSKNKAEIYCQNTFVSAEAAIEFYMGTMAFTTDYFPLNYVNEMIIELELVTELPVELAYASSSGRVYSRGIINEFWYEDGYWNDGVGSLNLHISGQKTYDTDGEDNMRGCYFDWRIYDEEGVVMGSGSFYSDKLKVGEVFKDEESYASDLLPGKYFIELSDHQ